ncbi:MAG: hypothetical protein CMJ89_08030 [Planctomycetes bacterium]|nr:hypothetical protein [Planctomycetota bacterium]
MQPNPRERRRVKLIKPRFQLKLVGVFVGLSALGFMLQAMHVGLRLSELAASLPVGGTHLMAVIPDLPLEILTVSFGMLLPFIVAVGILVTFRIAGPVHRFEKFLRSVLDGEETGPCRLRKGDEFGDLCELINEVTAGIRQSQLKSVSSSTAADQDSDAEGEELRPTG